MDADQLTLHETYNAATRAITVVNSNYADYSDILFITSVLQGSTGNYHVFALIAAVSYLTKMSLTSGFYKIALLLYGSGPLIMVFLYGFPL